MSNCSCCGKCDFPCCGGKVPSNVCMTVEETKILNITKINSLATYNHKWGLPSISDVNDGSQAFNCNIGSTAPICQQYPFMQYTRSAAEINSGFSMNEGIFVNNYSYDASYLNITGEAHITQGSLVSCDLYLFFPMKRVVFSDPFHPYDWSKNYQEEYGFGIPLGGLGDFSGTYDFTDTQQYRIRTTQGYSQGLVGVTVPELDVSFGDFGLCRCCNNTFLNTYYFFFPPGGQISNPNLQAAYANEVGTLFGYVHSIVTLPQSPRQNDGTVAAQIALHAVVTYDRRPRESGVRLQCPAVGLRVSSAGSLYQYREDKSFYTQVSNVKGWGEILNSTVLQGDGSSASLPARDCLIGLASPKIVSDAELAKQGLSGFVSQINSETATSMADAWISIKNVFEARTLNSATTGPRVPFQLKDLDGSVLAWYGNITTDIKTIDGIQFHYPVKLSDFAAYLSATPEVIPPYFDGSGALTPPEYFSYAEAITQNDPSTFTYDCSKINSGDDFLTFTVNYFSPGALYQYKVSAIKMLDKAIPCDVNEFPTVFTNGTQYKYCNDCYAVNIDGLGYISKYFRLGELYNSNNNTGQVGNVDLIYDEDENAWLSTQICRNLVCNLSSSNGTITVPEYGTVVYKLTFSGGGAHLNVDSQGDNTFNETYNLPNNGDCKLMTQSLFFQTKDDGSPITAHFINSCSQFNSPVIQTQNISYLVIPFWMLYPNNR